MKDQPASNKRNKDGSVDRKPLKTKPKIDPKYFRYIPIYDKGVFDILVKYAKLLGRDYKAGKYGTNLQNYMPFYDRVTDSTLNIRMTKFYEKKSNLKGKPLTTYATLKQLSSGAWITLANYRNWY